MRDAFAPVGLCIERYDSVYPAGSTQTFPVSIDNDTAQDWDGEVRVEIVSGGPAVTKKTDVGLFPAVTRTYHVQADGKTTQNVLITIPEETGDYTLVAEYGQGADRVQCVRDFMVGKVPPWVRQLPARKPSSS